MSGSNSVRQSVDLVVGELTTASAEVVYGEWEAFPELILGSNAIFTVGNGRSGLALRMAAMRLMHLGRAVHVVGETTTPAISEGDLLIAVSGSGTTNAVMYAAETALKKGATVVAVTANPSSVLAKIASHVLTIPAPEKTDRGGQVSKQYAGTLFEQMVLVLLDAVFNDLRILSEQPDDVLYTRHGNLG